MTTLRTLKDMKGLLKPYSETEDDELIFKKDLKSLAIKWVKNNMWEENGMTLNDWIKHFFNLTEEDLK